jgi:hypothetical protein
MFITAEMPFSTWVFETLVSIGAIKDYSRTEKSGKGKPPKGNLSVQITRISELRTNGDNNLRLWGIISYAGLQTNGEIGPKLKTKVEEYCQKCNPQDPNKLYDAIAKAAKNAATEFKARYKENPK